MSTWSNRWTRNRGQSATRESAQKNGGSRSNRCKRVPPVRGYEKVGVRPQADEGDHVLQLFIYFGMHCIKAHVLQSFCCAL